MNEQGQYQYPRCECHFCTQSRLSQFERAILHSQQRTEHQELGIERREARALERIADILERAFPQKAQSATLTISDSKGNTLMPATLAVGATAVALLHEFSGLNGTGGELKPIGPVAYSSSDPTIATVDPNTGLITAVAAGTATITGTDSGNGLSASDSVSDTPLVAQSATLVITPN